MAVIRMVCIPLRSKASIVLIVGCFMAIQPVTAFAFAQMASEATPAPAAKTEEALENRTANLARPEWNDGLAGSFLSSRFAKQHQDIAEAAKYMTRALKRDPGNIALQQEAMRALVKAGDLKEATAFAHTLTRTQAQDPLVATLLMIEQYQQGNFAKARKAMELPADRGLFGVIKPAIDQWLAIAHGGLTSPVTMQVAIDKSGFFGPFLTYHAALMNDLLGFSDIARKQYALASTDASVVPYRVVEAYANFYLRQEERAKAQQLFDTYAAENPESNLIPEPFARDAMPRPLVANAGEGLAELFFSTASILFGEELTGESFLYLRLALALRPDLPPAQLMLANIYETNKEYKEAIRIYESIKPGNVFYRRGQLRRALNLEAMGRIDEAIESLKELAEAYPNDESALITLGDIKREQKQYERSIEYYSLAMSRIEQRLGKLRATDWPLYYARGVASERAGMWNAAERDFYAALKLEPNQPDVLNYLGYSWVIQGKNMEKAQEYIELALSAKPDDPHILDSMGWAYYMRGDYAKAIEYLERAADIMPQDITINDHLGDAYWQTGRQVEASYQWQRALNFKPEGEEAERIREKLARGLPSTNTNGARKLNTAADMRE
jgi:tetratricopeptide (TPR) repeat protein